MAITDPIGDLLTRIRNGQMRGLAKIKSPNSRLRIRLLDVLQAEGFIRGYAEVEFKGHKELEIELKYHEGEPVIRELKRVSTPGRRVYSSRQRLEAASQRPGRVHPLDAAGRDDGHLGAREECRRRSPLSGVLRKRIDVPYRQKASRAAQGRHRLGRWPDREGQGPQGRAQVKLVRRSRRRRSTSMASPSRPRKERNAAARCGACRARW